MDERFPIYRISNADDSKVTLSKKQPDDANLTSVLVVECYTKKLRDWVLRTLEHEIASKPANYDSNKYIVLRTEKKRKIK